VGLGCHRAFVNWLFCTFSHIFWIFFKLCKFCNFEARNFYHPSNERSWAPLSEKYKFISARIYRKKVTAHRKSAKSVKIAKVVWNYVNSVILKLETSTTPQMKGLELLFPKNTNLLVHLYTEKKLWRTEKVQKVRKSQKCIDRITRQIAKKKQFFTKKFSWFWIKIYWATSLPNLVLFKAITYAWEIIKFMEIFVFLQRFSFLSKSLIFALFVRKNII